MELETPVIAIIELGLWNGVHKGYHILKSNLNEIMNTLGCDDIEVYINHGNVKAKHYHHDGTNNVTFRQIRNADNIERLEDRIISGQEISSSLMNYYTKSLVPEVRSIFGF